MKTGQMIGIVALMASSLMAQTNVWTLAEKYDRKCDGWVKGGTLSPGGHFGISKVSGKMESKSALVVRQKTTQGVMETKKVFPVPAQAQGKKITAEALMGYNFEINGVGETRVDFIVILLNNRNEKLAEKSLTTSSSRVGSIDGTSENMGTNRLVFDEKDTGTITSIQVVMRATSSGRNQGRKICIAELWLRELTLMAE